jgi:hypothetical protein
LSSIQGHTSRSRRKGFGRSRDIRSHGIRPQFRKGSLRVVAARFQFHGDSLYPSGIWSARQRSLAFKSTSSLTGRHVAPWGGSDIRNRAQKACQDPNAPSKWPTVAVSSTPAMSEQITSNFTGRFSGHDLSLGFCFPPPGF